MGFAGVAVKELDFVHVVGDTGGGCDVVKFQRGPRQGRCSCRHDGHHDVVGAGHGPVVHGEPERDRPGCCWRGPCRGGGVHPGELPDGEPCPSSVHERPRVRERVRRVG